MNVPAAPIRTHQHVLMDPTSFEQIIRVGDMLASSVLFPDHLRKGSAAQAKANGALVMNMAVRLNEDPLTVAQSIFFVGGRPGWHTQYMIAKANQHGTFQDQIDWEVSGKGDSLSVTAFATLAKTGRKVSMTCDMDMARAENWVKNPKYKSMPEVMLRYRSAAFLIRFYAPEVMVGIPMQVELELEMKDVTPDDAAMKAATQRPAKQEPEDAVLVDEPTPEQDAAEDKPEPKSAEKPKPVQEEAQDEPDQDALDQLQNTATAITNDLEAGGTDGVDGVMEFYAPQVEKLKNDAPHLHEQVMTTAQQARDGAFA